MKLDTQQTVSSLQFPGHSTTKPVPNPAYGASQVSPNETYAAQHNEPAVNFPVSLGAAGKTSYTWQSKNMPKPKPKPADFERERLEANASWVQDINDMLELRYQ